jgi:DNA-binding NarL/FixJ family response regulator
VTKAEDETFFRGPGFNCVCRRLQRFAFLGGWGLLGKSAVRVLVVDDFGPWRLFICSMLQGMPELQVVSQVADGFEAVQKALELRPDLILLDISLPKLNGIEAARRIRHVAPNSKILFLTQNLSPEIFVAALDVGGDGYILKPDAGNELLTAIEAVLQGRQFVSARLPSQGWSTDEHALDDPRKQGATRSSRTL